MNYDNDLGLIDTLLTIDTTESPPLGGLVNSLTILGTGSLVLPKGTTAQQPGSPSGSMLRFNTDTSLLEYYNSTIWSGVQPSLGYTPVNKAGDSMNSGANLTFVGGGKVTGLPTPTLSSDAAPKSYVDSLQAGLEWKEEVVASSIATDIATSQFTGATYYNGISNDGVGATLTAAVNGALSLDSWTTYTPGVSRVLIKDYTGGTTPTNVVNGIYTVTTVGDGSTQWVLTRVADANNTASLNNATVYATNGTTLNGTGWTQTTANPTLGTSGIVFVQFNSSITYTAGTGLTLTVHQFSLTSPVDATLGGTGTTTAPTSGQLLVGTVGGEYVPYTLASGTGISTTPGSGTLQINNTGVTAFTSGTGLSTNTGATGSVSVTNTGVLSFSAGTTGLTPSSPTTGAIVLSGTLIAVNGGTGQNTYAVGDLLLGAAANTLSKLGIGATGYVLTSNGTTASWVAAGSSLMLYAENPSTPTTPVASGTNAVAIGSGSTASGTNTFAVGDGTNASIWGGKTVANGKFATAGDAQGGTYVLRNITTDNTDTELFLDGTAGTQRLVFPNNSAFTVSALIVGRRTDATGGAAGYKIEAIASKDTTSASMALIGGRSRTTLGETDSAWQVDMVADTVNGSLKIIVTGQNAKTIRWVATVRTAEVTN